MKKPLSDPPYDMDLLVSSTANLCCSIPRKWHRLYSTSMFVSDMFGSSATTMDKVCDIAGCDVAAKPGDVPYVFIVCNKQGTRFEFQVSSLFPLFCGADIFVSI